jgi:hypothetical protein
MLKSAFEMLKGVKKLSLIVLLKINLNIDI